VHSYFGKASECRVSIPAFGEVKSMAYSRPEWGSHKSEDFIIIITGILTWQINAK